MSAVLWSLIDARRLVLKARVSVLDQFGLVDLVRMAEIVEELELLAALARQLHAEAVGPRANPTEVALLLEGLVDRVRLHLDVQPVDFTRIKELLEAGVEACEAAP